MSDPTKLETTLDDPRDPAVICRERGWIAGTKLVGDEGFGPEVILITAVGEQSILARTLTRRGEGPDWAREALWCLSCRDWQVQP